MERPSNASWKITVPCAGCGAELAVEPDRHTVDCEFCQATSVVDLGGVATCFRLGSALDDAGTSATALRWLREQGLQETMIDLEVGRLLLIPFWSVETTEGKRSMLALDQADLPLPPDVKQPVGQLEHIDLDEVGATNILEPSVPLPAAICRLGVEAEGAEISLIYAPFSLCTYAWGESSYQLLVDRAAEGVYAFAWPIMQDTRLDRRLGFLLALALALFTGLAALIPGLVLPAFVLLLVAIPMWWVLDRFIVSSRENP